MKTCKDKLCPDRDKCAIAQKQIEGYITIWKGYLNDPTIPKNKQCSFFEPIKKEIKK